MRNWGLLGEGLGKHFFVPKMITNEFLNQTESSMTKSEQERVADQHRYM